MTAVMIGVDPARRSHAMAVLDGRENELAALQISNDNAGYQKMLRLAKWWKQRTWAVEVAGGVGVQLAQRLVADGESVVDVPPKLSTRARIFDTGHGRKTDPGAARPIAVVALRTRNRRQVVLDDRRIALRLMADRRRELVRSRTHTQTQTVNHLHQLLMDLLAAGAGQKLTAAKAKALLVTIWPRAVAGKARRQLSVDLIDDLVTLDRKIRYITGRLTTAVEATGTRASPTSRASGSRPLRGARGGRGYPLVPQPAPLRQLHRVRPDRGVLWRGRTSSTLTRREPQAQQRAAPRSDEPQAH